MKLRGRKNKGVVRTSGGVDARTSADDTNLQPLDVSLLDNDHARHPKSSNSELIDAYELRIEELGRLMLEQGKHLDELTNRSRRLSTENTMLREKVSSGIENLIAKHNKSPLNSMIRHQVTNQMNNTKTAQKDKEDNDLLHQQTELLVDELTHSNKQISELEKELKQSWEHSRQQTAEKNVLRTNIMEKNSEIELLKSDVKTLNKLRSQFASKSEHLLSERQELKEEVVALGTQIKHSSSHIESLHNQLMTRQSEVDRLIEQCQLQERENHIAKRDARVNQETAARLREDLHREKQHLEQVEGALEEARNKIDDRQVSDISNTATVESLRSEIKRISKKHNETLSEFTQAQKRMLSAINQQHTTKVHSLEKAVTELQRAKAILENEHSRCLREKQSSDQRYYACEQQCNNKENEHKRQIQLLMDRANDAEVKLDTSLSAQQDLKREVASLEAKILEMHCAIKEMNGKHDKTTEQLKTELLNATKENEYMSIQIPTLRNQIETARLECRKEIEKIKSETERKLKEAEVECEALRVSKSNDQLKAKESRTAFEKAVVLHQTVIEQMKSEAKTVRIDLEKVISDERSASERLMAKIQELNQAVQSLTWEKHQSKSQIKGLIEKNNDLERIVASGDVKLRNLGLQLSKSVEEQERCIKAEAELKTLRMELIKIRSKRDA
eukprot:CCRYP_003960-RA/>CCRYP_003960-RA protein AED:0.09 eAED:0.02 QI:0/0/0/1/1/1/4/0/674